MNPPPLETMLSERLHTADFRHVVEWAAESKTNMVQLWAYAGSANNRISKNALWCLTHLRNNRSTWLQDEFIDMLLVESNISKKRMLLQLLRELEYSPDNMRVDFLDFCMSKINSECEPYAVRSFSLYAAYKMCRFYPELIDELTERLDMLSRSPISPGLECARRKVYEYIRKPYQYLKYET